MFIYLNNIIKFNDFCFDNNQFLSDRCCQRVRSRRHNVVQHLVLLYGWVGRGTNRVLDRHNTPDYNPNNYSNTLQFPIILKLILVHISHELCLVHPS